MRRCQIRYSKSCPYRTLKLERLRTAVMCNRLFARCLNANTCMAAYITIELPMHACLSRQPHRAFLIRCGVSQWRPPKGSYTSTNELTKNPERSTSRLQNVFASLNKAGTPHTRASAVAKARLTHVTSQHCLTTGSPTPTKRQNNP